MEKIKNLFSKLKFPSLGNLKSKVSKFFFVHSESTSKKDIQWKNVIIFFSCCMILLTFLVFLKPEQDQRKFREVESGSKNLNRAEEKKEQEGKKTTASQVWQSPQKYQFSQSAQPNLNTPMLVSPGGSANAHLQFSAGTKIKVKMAEKFMASQDATPVIAIIVEDIQTEAGQVLPQGSQLYGEASYVASSERAKIEFKQLALPNGQIKPLQATIISLDNQKGLKGKVHSDGMKNSAGQVITTFVGGLAAGSVERNLMGQSKGGISNGLLNAVADTAKNRTQKYGDSLKEAREWIEIEAGADGYAVLTQSLKMIDSEVNHE